MQQTPYLKDILLIAVKTSFNKLCEEFLKLVPWKSYKEATKAGYVGLFWNQSKNNFEMFWSREKKFIRYHVDMIFIGWVEDEQPTDFKVFDLVYASIKEEEPDFIFQMPDPSKR